MRPFRVTASVLSTTTHSPRLSIVSLIAALGVCAAAPAAALVPGDLCTGNPCVISADVVIDASVVLDFGNTTALEFAPGISVLLQNGANVHFEAGSITVGSGVRFSSDAPGSSLYLDAQAGNLTIASDDSIAKFVLRDSVEVGLYATGDIQLRTSIDVTGYSNEAGAVSVQALGSLTGKVNVRGDGSKLGFNASVISFEADGALSLISSIAARGRGGDSGQVSFRGASVALSGRVHVRPLGGVGGSVSVNATGGDATLDAAISASGSQGFGAGPNFCDGGQVSLAATGSVFVNRLVDVTGGGAGGCRGGSFTGQAGADFVQSTGVGIRVGSAGYTSFGGQVSIQATGDATLRRIDARSDTAGSIAASAGGTLNVFGSVGASSNGSGDAADGSINLTGTCGLHITPSGRVVARQAASSGGQITLTTSGGPMTIEGTVAASNSVTLQYVTGFPPDITGTVNPDPSLIETSSGTCGS